MTGQPVNPPHRSARQRALTEQRIVAVSSAVGRALAQRPDLARRGRLWQLADRPLQARAPHVHPLPEIDDWRSLRGATDAVALLVRHSDPELRARNCPRDDVLAALIFEMLEQFRVESLADPGLPGIRANLDHRFAAWAEQLVSSGAAETEQGMVVLTVAHLCRSRVLGGDIPEAVSDLIEATRNGLGAAIGGPLSRLRGLRQDQAGYAVVAADLARAVATQVARARAQELADGDSDGDSDDEEDEAPKQRELFSLLVGFEAAGDAAAPVPVLPAPGRAVTAHGDPYRVFTRAHDRVSQGTDLLLTQEREALMHELARLVRDSDIRVRRLAHRLATVLGTPQTRGWDEDREEGLLDPSRLPRLVTRPGQTAVFRTPRSMPGTGAALTFLVDCSGSMKAHRGRLAPLLETWTRALHLAGVQVEVLGHTTVSWGGASARKDWQRAGRPARPGRLAETQHTVMVGADTSRRGLRAGLTPLLKTSLYREGVDGEAISWAADRLGRAQVRRRILAVVSDGSPMETSTARANDADYLDRHLCDVVSALERRARRGAEAPVQVLGVGVGLDLSAYYERYTVLDLDRPLPAVSQDLLAALTALSR